MPSGASHRTKPVCGRLLCYSPLHQGPRWLPLVYFHAREVNAAGEALSFRPSCRTCCCIEKRADRLRRGRRLRDRERRKRAGEYLDGSTRDEVVDSGPFVAWLEIWRERQERRKTSRQRGFQGAPASFEDLAKLTGCNSRTFRYAQSTGKVSVALVDRVLIAAGGDTMLWELYDLETLEPQGCFV